MSKPNEHPAHTKEEDRFASDLESLQSNFAQLREDVSDLMNNAVGTARSGARAVQSRARHAARDLRDYGSDSLEDLGDRIGERPLTSAAIAVAIGFVAARWLLK